MRQPVQAAKMLRANVACATKPPHCFMLLSVKHTSLLQNLYNINPLCFIVQALAIDCPPFYASLFSSFHSL
jgi:hypothetical protein